MPDTSGTATERSPVTLWPSKSENDTRSLTLTWTTADGTSYAAPDNKVSGSNGLKVPAGTASTGATPK
jgi:hypothetical protein